MKGFIQRRSPLRQLPGVICIILLLWGNFSAYACRKQTSTGQVDRYAWLPLHPGMWWEYTVDSFFITASGMVRKSYRLRWEVAGFWLDPTGDTVYRIIRTIQRTDTPDATIRTLPVLFWIRRTQADIRQDQNVRIHALVYPVLPGVSWQGVTETSPAPTDPSAPQTVEQQVLSEMTEWQFYYADVEVPCPSFVESFRPCLQVIWTQQNVWLHQDTFWEIYQKGTGLVEAYGIHKQKDDLSSPAFTSGLGYHLRLLRRGDG